MEINLLFRFNHSRFSDLIEIKKPKKRSWRGYGVGRKLTLLRQILTRGKTQISHWKIKTTKYQWLNARYDRIAKNITRKYCIYGDYLFRQLGIQCGGKRSNSVSNGHFNILGKGLELACNRGSCEEILVLASVVCWFQSNTENTPTAYCNENWDCNAPVLT